LTVPGDVPVPHLLTTEAMTGAPLQRTREPLRLALVNDHAIVVAGVDAMLLPYANRVEIVHFDLDAPSEEPIDVAVYDTFAAPQCHTGGLGALLERPNIAKVVAYSFTEDEDAVRDALAAGVDGYVSKALPGERLVEALERIAAGHRLVLLSENEHHEYAQAWPGQDIDLTERESEVISLITQGYSNEEIARTCYLSINTVKTYIRSAYRKAGVSTRAQAVAWALRHGFRPEPRARG
jgi:DNA-binding NarL/FixJ family response regulator